MQLVKDKNKNKHDVKMLCLPFNTPHKRAEKQVYNLLIIITKQLRLSEASSFTKNMSRGQQSILDNVYFGELKNQVLESFSRLWKTIFFSTVDQMFSYQRRIFFGTEFGTV